MLNTAYRYTGEGELKDKIINSFFDIMTRTMTIAKAEAQLGID